MSNTILIRSIDNEKVSIDDRNTIETTSRGKTMQCTMIDGYRYISIDDCQVLGKMGLPSLQDTHILCAATGEVKMVELSDFMSILDDIDAAVGTMLACVNNLSRVNPCKSKIYSEYSLEVSQYKSHKISDIESRIIEASQATRYHNKAGCILNYTLEDVGSNTIQCSISLILSGSIADKPDRRVLLSERYKYIDDDVYVSEDHMIKMIEAFIVSSEFNDRHDIKSIVKEVYCNESFKYSTPIMDGLKYHLIHPNYIDIVDNVAAALINRDIVVDAELCGLMYQFATEDMQEHVRADITSVDVRLA